MPSSPDGPCTAYLSTSTSFAAICCFPGGLDDSASAAAPVGAADSCCSSRLTFLLFECLCFSMVCGTRCCCCCCRRRHRRCSRGCTCWLSPSFVTASSAVQLLGELLSAPTTDVPSALQPGSALLYTRSLCCSSILDCSVCSLGSCEGTLLRSEAGSSSSSSASSWHSAGGSRAAKLG